MTKQEIEKVRNLAFASTPPPAPDQLGLPPETIVDELFITYDGAYPKALLPTDVTFELQDILIPNQFIKDVQFFAHARTAVLNLCTHILYLEQIIEGGELETESQRILQELRTPKDA